MIELISLKFGNFRSFVDDQHILFQGRDKLVQIDGRNENTGGSSGAGKTTILMALDYLLGIGDVPSTVLQSRLTKDGLWASGEFIIDDTPVSISRSKKDGLIIKTPEETVSGNSKLAEEKLLFLIGLPIKIFKKMIHKKQKEGGFFLNMTPKETYEFLISVLGLEKYIKDIDTISKSSEEYVAKIIVKELAIQLNKASLLDMERVLSEKKKPDDINIASDEEIRALNQDITTLRGTIYSFKQQTQCTIDQLPKTIPFEANTSVFNKEISALVPERAELNGKLNNIDESRNKLQSDINSIPHYIEKAIKFGEKINSLKEEKIHIEKAQCPTCMQEWVGDLAQDKIAKINAEIDFLTTQALSLKKSIEEKPQLQENMDRLLTLRENVRIQLVSNQDKRADLDAKKYQLMELTSKQNQEAKDAYNKQISEIENKTRDSIDTCNKTMKEIEIQLSAKESQRNSYLIATAQYLTEVASINDMISKKQQEAVQTNLELQSIRKNIIVADESKRLIKAYVLQTFQETLDAIGEVATNILSAIPNMATSTVYFEGCKETKSGSIKDEVVAILNTDGNNEIPIKSLSGGERTAIDLAIDLAVIDVIETKVAKGANFLFMDEPFDGLDSVCKENCLEILKQIDTNKKIIMVDHSSELKEMVSDIILVVKKGEISNIAI